MAVQKQDDQHEHRFSNYVRIRDIVLKTCLVRWTIGRSGRRGSGISVLPARHDDDDDCSVLFSLCCPVGWGCRIHRLLLCRWVRHPPPNECPGYDIKHSDRGVPAMLEFCRVQNTPLSPSHRGPLRPRMEALDRSPIYVLNRTKEWLAFTVFTHLNCVFMLNWIV